MVVTTAHGAGPDAKAEGLRLAARLDAVFAPRDGRSLEDLLAEHGAAGALVVGSRRVSLFFGEQQFFFHPGTAALRINNLLAGKPDQMIQAMDLQPGDKVLDCTLGLGADAVVASFVVGSRGRVVGVERVAAVAAVVEHGLRHYCVKANPRLEEALRRIEVVTADHLDYLRGAPVRSFDVVYFDPFFRTPLQGGDQIKPLRALGSRMPLSKEAVVKALRVARRRVVVKERRGSAEFVRLGFKTVSGGRYARVAYGVIEIE
ncbi:MAG: class I SAM-dependent methyltransferase [Bacillota bacterium]